MLKVVTVQQTHGSIRSVSERAPQILAGPGPPG